MQENQDKTTSRTLTMLKSHPDRLTQYEKTIKKLEKQTEDMMTIFHKVIAMRYDTALVGLQTIKATKELEECRKKLSEVTEEEKSDDSEHEEPNEVIESEAE